MHYRIIVIDDWGSNETHSSNLRRFITLCSADTYSLIAHNNLASYQLSPAVRDVTDQTFFREWVVKIRTRVVNYLQFRHWMMNDIWCPTLFQLLLTNPNRVLSSLFPDKTDSTRWPHERRRWSKLFSDNFMIQTAIDLCISCVLTTFNEDNDDDDEVLTYLLTYLLIPVVDVYWLRVGSSPGVRVRPRRTIRRRRHYGAADWSLLRLDETFTGHGRRASQSPLHDVQLRCFRPTQRLQRHPHHRSVSCATHRCLCRAVFVRFSLGGGQSFD